MADLLRDTLTSATGWTTVVGSPSFAAGVFSGGYVKRDIGSAQRVIYFGLSTTILAGSSASILFCVNAGSTEFYRLNVNETRWAIYKGAALQSTGGTGGVAGDAGEIRIDPVTGLSILINGVELLTLADVAYVANTWLQLLATGSTGNIAVHPTKAALLVTDGVPDVVVLTAFQQAYIDLLIKQYWSKTKASAEIALQAGAWERVRDFFRAFEDGFDIDQAVGAQLDILGKWVQLSRVSAVPVPVSMQGATASQLSDAAYRVMIKVKVARNVAAAYMTSDTRISLQDVIVQAFGGEAFVVDSLHMALTMMVLDTLDLDLPRYTYAAGLLPKPQGVRYRHMVVYAGESFGFADNPSAVGFADKDDAPVVGNFAEKELF